MAVKATKSVKRDNSASGQYAAYREQIKAALKVVCVELAAFDAEQAQNPDDWGFVGSAGKVREDLLGVVAFLRNVDAVDAQAIVREARRI